MPTGTGTKRRKASMLARDRRQVGSLYLRGWLQADIAEAVGISQSTVSRDLSALHKGWMREGLNDYGEAKARELAKVDELERTYWQAWIDSREAKETKTQEQAGLAKSQRTKRSVKLEKRDGDPRYLAGVMTCINKRCQLLGLDAPKDDSLTLKGDKESPIEFIVGGVNLATEL